MRGAITAIDGATALHAIRQCVDEAGASGTSAGAPEQ